MSRMTHRDHISNLPNEVLSHILSRLPIKDAVRTCVLSKYWEFKWTSIYDVDIDTETFSLEKRNERTFVSIAENVLLNVSSIRQCRLICISLVQNELSRIANLLSAIFLRRNLKCLELEIFNMEDFSLPRSLSNCASLTKLRFWFSMPCTLRVPTDNSFLKLKKLFLRGVNFSSCISETDTLVLTFPVLKLLELIACKWVDVSFVEIHAPSLCKVTFITPYEFNDKKDLDYSIKIFGRRVDEFTVDGGYPENISLIGSTVTNASLRCTFDHPPISLEECGLQARKKFRALPNLTCLSIFDLRAIGQTERGVPLPRFTELKRLHLYTPFDAEGFLKLLHAAPNLKFLAILLDCFYEYDYDSVKPLPSCIVHHLEEVRFDYSDKEYLLKNYLVEKFLLKNGAKLKTVFILGSRKFLESTEEKLSRFPKASSRLNIVFVRN